METKRYYLAVTCADARTKLVGCSGKLTVDKGIALRWDTRKAAERAARDTWADDYPNLAVYGLRDEELTPADLALVPMQDEELTPADLALVPMQESRS